MVLQESFWSTSKSRIGY